MESKSFRLEYQSISNKPSFRSTAGIAKQPKAKEKEYDEHDLAHQAKLKEEARKKKELADKLKSGKKG